MKLKTKRLLKAVSITLFALLVGFVTAIYTVLKFSLPPTNGSLALDGLQRSVEITYDSLGVPQIWATTEHDSFFALGWQHAADRLFQMELLRRVSQGRLSELLGEMTLRFDIDQRRFGHHRSAKKALENLSSSNHDRLKAYADGVNAYVDNCRTLPFEFYLLPAPFEKWTIFDCLTILSFETWYSDALQNSEEFFLNLAQVVTEEQFQRLISDYPDWAPVTVPATDDSPGHGSISNENPARMRAELSGITRKNRFVIPVSRPSTSSNGWVIAPTRSASSRAMLAGDPHLEITRLPQFWYAVGVHIEETGLEALGISIPGLPFIIMGHNGQAAWCFTAAGIDITDYYKEFINPHDSSQYLFSIRNPHNGPSDIADADSAVWRSFDIYQDTITVAGWDTSLIIGSRWTRHGPIEADRFDDNRVLALRWAGFDAELNEAASAAFGLMDVADFSSFRKIVTSMGALDANWLYTDSTGNIGYQLGTPLPVRPVGSGKQPLPGWNKEYDWQGYYPLEQTPHAFNPDRGYLANCNNIPQRAPHITGNFAPDRILRLTHLLESKDRLSLSDMMAFQLDTIDASLLLWQNEVVGLLERMGDTARAELIRSWDGNTGQSSHETALMMSFLNELPQAVFEDELGNLAGGIKRPILMEKYRDPGHEWVDDQTTANRIETAVEIGLQALQNTLEQIDDSTWGEIHSLSMRHPMAIVPIFGSLLDLAQGPWPWSGTSGTLNSSFTVTRSDGHYESIVGPSWRFVIDFADIDNAQMVLPAGNSGNPMSEHFFDFNELWRTGRYWTVPFSRKRVKEHAKSVLILDPTIDEN